MTTVLLPVRVFASEPLRPLRSLRSLAGASIAVVSNLRNRNPLIAELLNQVFVEEHGANGATLIEHEYMSTALTDERVDDIVDRFDAVVGTYGGCGSCTAAVTRSTSLVNRLGVPGLMIAAENFARQVSFLSRAWGAPTLQSQIYAWDFEALPEADFAEQFLATVPTIVSKLCATTAGSPSTEENR